MLFLHADAVFDPHVQASEMGRVAGGIGNVETSGFFSKFNSRLSRCKGDGVDFRNEKPRAKHDREERGGRTALQSRIDQLAARPCGIALEYREHQGRCSGLGDAERGLRVPATGKYSNSLEKQGWKSKSREAN